jgi:hypothetical protein
MYRLCISNILANTFSISLPNLYLNFGTVYYNLASLPFNGSNSKKWDQLNCVDSVDNISK